MANIHEIGVGADTKPFEQGIRKGVIDPVEDATKAFGKLQDSVSDAGTGGARSLDKLEDKLKDVQRQSEKLDSTTDSFRDTSRRSFEGASENVQGFKEEAVQNFSEVASSFNGDVQGMADGVQGLTGGLASSLTPGLGIPIAILGAAAGAFLQSWITSTQESKQRVSDMYDDMTESGQDFLSADFIQKGIAEQFKDHLGDVEEHMKQTGATSAVVGAAMAGDIKSVIELLDIQTSKRDAEIAAIRATGGTLDDQAIKIDAVNAKYTAQDAWLVQLQKDNAAATDQAKASNQAVSDYLKTLIEGAKEATVQVDEFGDKLFELPDGKQIVIDAETGQASTDLTKFKGDVNSVPKTVTTTAKLIVDTSAWERTLAKIRKTEITLEGNVVYTLPGGRKIQ